MPELQTAVLLRIFTGEAEKQHGKPCHEWIVERAQECGLAGATVLRGFLGFGISSQVHTSKILRLSLDLPVVIEIVDEEEKIHAFLPELEEVAKVGLVTLERVQVLRGGNTPD